MRSIALLARDEVSRLLSTRRGLLSLIGFVALWLALLVYVILPAATFFDGASETGLSDLLLGVFGLGEAWRKWPAPEIAIYWVLCLYLLPFFALLSAADQTASDRSRGTLRYLVLRCSRLQIYLGRFFGQCAILLLVILLTLASVVILIALDSPDRLREVITRVPVIVINLLLVVAPYIALMALVSAMARSARQATLYAVIFWVLASLLIAYVQARFEALGFLDWVLPGAQVKQLVLMADWQTLVLAPVPLLQTLVLLVAGGWVMWRHDL
ncbi:MAG: ABC transporter permease [Granulosicoccus sp.]